MQIKEAIYQNILKNGHIIVIGLILSLSGSNYVLFNYFEVVLTLVFFFLSEMIFKWPYLYKQRTLLMKFLKM